MIQLPLTPKMTNVQASAATLSPSATVLFQPPPQALRFSQGRGERLVRNRKGPWEGYRRLSPFRLPLRAHFHRKRRLGTRQVLFSTTITRAIMLHLLMKWLLGSNFSHKKNVFHRLKWLAYLLFTSLLFSVEQLVLLDSWSTAITEDSFVDNPLFFPSRPR